jgi:hypothetical protein
MGRRASLIAIVVASVACGATPGAPPANPATEWSSPAATNGFGTPMIAAARAMLLATQKRPYDPGWNCADANGDLRATPASATQAVEALGASPVLVVAAVRLAMNADAGAGVEVRDSPDKGAVARVFLNGYANVSPDAKVTWSEVKAYASALEEPNKERARIDDLAAPLRAELHRLADSAGSEDCRVPVTTIGDVEELPYAMGLEERNDVARALETNQRGLRNVCAIAIKAKPPWEAHFSHLEAVFTGGGTLVKMRSKLHIQKGALCLDAVEVVKVAKM